MTAVLFILMGAVLEGLPAVVIVLPTFLPVVKQLNIDLVHYCIVVVAATGIGLFLPPIGVGLFISCAIANITVDRRRASDAALRAVSLHRALVRHPRPMVHPGPAAPVRALIGCKKFIPGLHSTNSPSDRPV